MARSSLSGNDQRAENRWVAYAIGGAVVVLLTLVQLVRVTGVPVVRSIWAEDGSVFLTGALARRSVFSTYAGYLNVVPRSIGWVVAHRPLGEAAVWFAVVPAFVTSLLAVAVFRLSDFVVRSPWLRAVVASSLVLPPILVYESMASTANLQWPLVAALFWALARPATARWDLVTCAVIAVAAALSSSVALLFLPLAVLVVVLRRDDRRAWIVPGVFGVASIMQALAVLSTSAPAARGDAALGALPKLYAVNVVGESVLGHRLVDETWLGPGLAPFLALALALIAALTVLWFRCDGAGRLWGGVAVAASLVAYASTAFWRGAEQVVLQSGLQTGSGARYTGLGLQLLVAGGVVLVDRARMARRWHGVLVAVVVAQALLVPLASFRLRTERSDGPRWSSTLADAERACRGAPRATVQLLRVAPGGFVASVPCSSLD